MPLFDVKCSNCGHLEKDVLVRGSAHDHYSPSCPKCKKIGTLQKLPSAASFTIRGFSARNGYSGEK